MRLARGSPAWVFLDWYGGGPLSPGGDSPAATNLLAEFGRTPNATSSVAFNRSDDNQLEQFSWRINVTEVLVPNYPLQFGNLSANSSEGKHITNVQWQLQWPGDETGSFQEYLGQRNVSVHLWAWAATLPSNITSRATDQTNGNCSVILGEQCAQSLVAAVSQQEFYGTTGLAGCASTLDVGPLTGFGTEISSNETSTSALYSNGTLAYFATHVYAPNPRHNITEFDEVLGAVQILALRFDPNLNIHEASSNASVLCQIVDNTANISAAAWVQPNAIMWAIVVLSMLAMVWQ